MARKLNPIGAPVAEFKNFICSNEGVVADIFKEAKNFAATDSTLELTLDTSDVQSAVAALEEVQQRIDMLYEMLPAQEALESRANSFVEKFLMSDRTKMLAFYNQQINMAASEKRLDKLIDDLEDDIEKMEDFIDGDITLSAFVRFLLSSHAILFAMGATTIACPLATIVLVIMQYKKLDKIRKKTSMLLPYMYDALKKAKAKHRALITGKIQAGSKIAGDDHGYGSDGDEDDDENV